MEQIKPDRAAMARFHRQATKQASGCWLWAGPSGADGYGRWRWKPGAPVIYTHIWAYIAFKGEIPDGLEVDHVCHTVAVQSGTCEGGSDCRHRRCCNPDHLELVTKSENTNRQNHANRRKQECPKGHPLSGDNLVVWSDGRRRCRECLRSRVS